MFSVIYTQDKIDDSSDGSVLKATEMDKEVNKVTQMGIENARKHNIKMEPGRGNSGDGNWKTNTHLGGSAETCEITNEIEDICIKAKDAVYGDIVGIDLMESNEKGMVVHEINNTTEFRNVVRVTGVDIPKLMLEYVKELA